MAAVASNTTPVRDCQVCTKLYKDKFGKDLPQSKDWEDANYRQWIKWNNDQVIVMWDMMNKVTTTAGGPDCIWVGMTRGVFTERNIRHVLEHSALSFQDHQSRSVTPAASSSSPRMA